MTPVVQADAPPDDASTALYGEDGQLQFFQEPAMDRFVAVMLKLTQELWVMNERVEMLERLSARTLPFDRQHIDAMLADPALIAEREVKMGEFVNRVLGPLREPT